MSAALRPPLWLQVSRGGGTGLGACWWALPLHPLYFLLALLLPLLAVVVYCCWRRDRRCRPLLRQVAVVICDLRGLEVSIKDEWSLCLCDRRRPRAALSTPHAWRHSPTQEFPT